METKLAHSLAALDKLFQQLGGETPAGAMVFVGSESRSPAGSEPALYYAGVGRPPAATPLEATLVWAADAGRFASVRIFCGLSRALPGWQIPGSGGSHYILGRGDRIAFSLYGAAPASTTTPVQDDDPLARAMANVSTANIHNVFSGKKLYHLPSRMKYLRDEFERAGQGSLLIVDDSWLTYNAQASADPLESLDDLNNQKWSDDRPLPNDAHTMSTWFAGLPAKCVEKKITLILLIHERARAEVFAEKEFHQVPIWKRGQGIPESRNPDIFYYLAWPTIKRADQIDLPVVDAQQPYGVHFAPASSVTDTVAGSDNLFRVLRHEVLLPKPDPFAKLRGKVGMDDVLRRLQRWYDDLNHGILKVEHIRIVGNPGTGKTMVARIIADCLRNMKILSRGHLVETDTSELTGNGLTGQTTNLLFKKLEEALGGVIFIDEIYGLNDSGYVHELIQPLLRWMDPKSTKEIVGIIAGYKDKVDEFLDKNDGLKSRFSYEIPMADYNVDDLWQIATTELAAEIPPAQVDEAAKEVFVEIIRLAKTRPGFGNARDAINFLVQARRIAISRQNAGNDSRLPDDSAIVIEVEDLQQVAHEQRGSQDES